MQLLVRSILIALVIGSTLFGIKTDTFAETERPKRPIDQVIAKGIPQGPGTIQKIVGGQPAQPGEYPFQVALIASFVNEGMEQLGQFCGGSLIDQRWVLTAAHCIPNTQPKEVDVYIGSTLLPTATGEAIESRGIRMHVMSIFPHPSYDPDTYDNDIAMLKLVGPAPDQLKTVKPATHELEKLHGNTGQDVTVIGWGGISEGSGTNPRLMKVIVQVQDREICEDNYRDKLPGINISKNMFCAGVPHGGKDSCQGDSGGFIGAPLGDGNFIQLGIVSWGIGCARPDLFGVYTRIANYNNWIKEIRQTN